jgi:hypothetical protein
MGAFTERLKQGNERYKSVGDGPDGPPPALYKFQLQKAEILEKNDGELQIIWQHFVLEGAHAGEVATDFSQLTSEQSFCIKKLRQRITRLGYDVPSDLGEYEELVPAIMAAGPTYTGRVIHKNGYSNVEIETLLESKGPTRTAPIPAAPATTTPAAAAASTEAEESDDEVDVKSRVSYVDKGVTYEGVINSFVGNEALLDVEGEKDLVAVPLGDLTVLPDAIPEADTEANAPGTVADLFDDLVALAEGNSIEVPDGADEASMIEVLGGYEWKRAELADHEAAVLEAVGIPMAEAAPKPKPKPKARPKAAKPKARPKAKPKKGGVRRKKR